MSAFPSPNPMPEAAAVAPAAGGAVPNSPEEGMKSLNGIMLAEAEKFGANAAVPNSPEEGMKNLNAIMSDMLAEAEKGAAIEKEANARLLSLLKEMRAYKEALAAKKQVPNSTEQFGMISHVTVNLILKTFSLQNSFAGLPRQDEPHPPIVGRQRRRGSVLEDRRGGHGPPWRRHKVRQESQDTKKQIFSATVT